MTPSAKCAPRGPSGGRAWFDWVAVCPIDDSGVAARGEVSAEVGLPVSANVLFQCIHEFAIGELACTPEVEHLHTDGDMLE